MMQGDPRVDDLMRLVGAAIKRHVKDREAATEIYNRAYEAVMNSMDVKAAELAAANEDAARWLVERDAANARAEKAEADSKRLRDALERFGQLDLTSPIGDAIAWDILNARAALKSEPK